jgi:hypothetical protein
MLLSMIAKGLFPDISVSVGSPVSGFIGPSYGVGVGSGVGVGAGVGVGEGLGVCVIAGAVTGGETVSVWPPSQADKNKRSISSNGNSFFMSLSTPPSGGLSFLFSAALMLH